MRGERVGHWSENTNSSAVVGCRVGVEAVNQTAAISSAVRTPVQDSKTSIQIHVVSNKTSSSEYQRERNGESQTGLWRGERKNIKINCRHSPDTLQIRTYGLILFISTMMNE